MNDHDLAKLRSELRAVDSELIDTLARRIRLVRKIGQLKKKLKMGVIDTLVETSAMENFVVSAGRAGVEQGYARRVAELIIEGSVEAQMQSRPPASSSDALLKQFSEIILRAEKKGRKLIRLDIGEPRFKTPSAVAREAKRFLSQHSPMLWTR
jgi:chorismate mutase